MQDGLDGLGQEGCLDVRREAADEPRWGLGILVKLKKRKIAILHFPRDSSINCVYVLQY